MVEDAFVVSVHPSDGLSLNSCRIVDLFLAAGANLDTGVEFVIDIHLEAQFKVAVVLLGTEKRVGTPLQITEDL